MNIESKVLQVENLSRMPFDDMLSLFRQGYRLEQNSNIGIELGLNVLNTRGNNIRSLATCKGSTCPCSVTKGGILTLSANASSGTVPYTYHWTVTKPDGSTDTSLTGGSNPYTFNQDGSYNVSVYVTDSCATGAKTSNTDSCKITASTGNGDGVATKYNCVGGVCQGPFTTGTYSSLAECQVACQVVATRYNCVSGVCQGPFTTGTYSSLAECQAVCTGDGGDGIDCPGCDLTKNYCLAGNCIPKNYVLVGGIGFIALLILAK